MAFELVSAKSPKPRAFLAQHPWPNSAWSATSWTQEAFIKPVNNKQFNYFGKSVAIDSDTLAVGAHAENSNQTTITNGSTASADGSAGSSGAVYVYKRTGTTWAQEAFIKASNAETSDQFGLAVALAGNILVAGADSEDSNQVTITNGTTASANNSTSRSGAAYIFRRSASSWAQEAYLKAPAASSDDFYGQVTAIYGETVVVGATNENGSNSTITNGTTGSSVYSLNNSGAVFIYTRD